MEHNLADAYACCMCFAADGYQSHRDVVESGCGCCCCWLWWWVSGRHRQAADRHKYFVLNVISLERPTVAHCHFTMMLTISSSSFCADTHVSTLPHPLWHRQWWPSLRFLNLCQLVSCFKLPLSLDLDDSRQRCSLQKIVRSIRFMGQWTSSVNFAQIWRKVGGPFCVEWYLLKE